MFAPIAIVKEACRSTNQAILPIEHCGLGWKKFRTNPTVWLDSLLRPRPAGSTRECNRPRRATRYLPSRKPTATSPWRFVGNYVVFLFHALLNKSVQNCVGRVTCGL